MPELPEVEVVRRGLADHVIGRTITAVNVYEPRSLRRQVGGIDRFTQALVGARIHGLHRRGKFLWWRLLDERGDELGEALMTHLGMSGQLRLREPAAAITPATPGQGPTNDPHAHLRLRLDLDDGSHVGFLDQRIFGGMWTSPLVPTPDGLPATATGDDLLIPASALGIGRDLLDPALDRASTIDVLRARRAPIKSLLLNQALVSGIGNIYADEGLWAASTRFDTPGEALTARRAGRVLDATAGVMQRALEVGGTSFDALYVNVDGRSGYFTRFLHSYSREGEPCDRCGTPIRRVAFANRSSHFCPRCQRRPRSK